MNMKDKEKDSLLFQSLTTQNRYSSTCMHKHVHGSTVRSSQKVETAQVSINRQVGRQIMGYTMGYYSARKGIK